MNDLAEIAGYVVMTINHSPIRLKINKRPCRFFHHKTSIVPQILDQRNI